MHTVPCLLNRGFYLPSGYTNLYLTEDYTPFAVLIQPFLLLHLSLQLFCLYTAAQEPSVHQDCVTNFPRKKEATGGAGKAVC